MGTDPVETPEGEDDVVKGAYADEETEDLEPEGGGTVSEPHTVDGRQD